MTKADKIKKETFLTENRDMIIERIKDVYAVKSGLVSLKEAMIIFKNTYMSTKGKTILDGCLAIESAYGDGIKSFVKTDKEINDQKIANLKNLPSSLRK